MPNCYRIFYQVWHSQWDPKYNNPVEFRSLRLARRYILGADPIWRRDFSITRTTGWKDLAMWEMLESGKLKRVNRQFYAIQNRFYRKRAPGYHQRSYDPYFWRSREEMLAQFNKEWIPVHEREDNGEPVQEDEIYFLRRHVHSG